MNLFQQTKELCRIYNIKPARSKGQNFLINEEIYNKIIEAAELKKNDVVLEVGPGLGFLTAKLAARVKQVIAVELDDKLADVLRIGLTAQRVKNVEVVNQSIINYQLSIINYKVVANIPYNITSQFLRKFLSAEYKPNLMVLMLQKEVAERIIAKPGKMSLLAVSVQFYAESEIIQIIPKSNFWPEPEVDSAIVKIKPHPKLLLDKREEQKDFFRLVRIGFSAKRKMLKNNLANGFHISAEEAEKRLKNAGFEEKIRAQELSVKDWVKLFGEFY
jgi:16S rRNA (adenine1518-N6/adenine1519-N6)-dimethyltransferase